MDARYEAFCIADPVFYESPAVGPSKNESHDDDGRFDQMHSRLPTGWSRHTLNEWTLFRPAITDLAEQGWKIHVSATQANAQAILDVVTEYCLSRTIPFKFLTGRRVLMARNSKYADRGGSGKFITVYPTPQCPLEQILAGLAPLLEGQAGPYILSDLRWGSGPLYLRYGGFRERWCQDADGDRVLAIVGPDGELVPDQRTPTFSVPNWITPPAVLAEALAARAAGERDFPFRVLEALHFSNGGGVYRGEDTRTGRTVLLKEARPLAGLDRVGADAVTRLQHERDILERLSGCSGVPAVLEYGIWWEHHFLVREFVEGDVLPSQSVRRHPLLRRRNDAGSIAGYTAWALKVLDDVERGLNEIHARGVVFGDLHPGNILVDEDGTVGFIDFEVASAAEQAVRSTLGAPGYVAPPEYTGVAIDRYALGCMRLALFSSLAPLIPWDPGKVDQLLKVVTERFPVPTGFAEQVWADLGPRPFRDRPGDPAPAVSGPGLNPAIWPAEDLDWPALRDSIVEAIVSSATPERSDRLFPGDIQQFAPGGGINLAHGAAGVLWALADSGADRFPDHEKWLLEAVRRQERPSAGFLTGLSGIAYVLDRLEYTEEALEILEQVRALPVEPGNTTLQDGMAGIGLNLMHFAARTGQVSLLEQARELAGPVVAGVGRDLAVNRQPGLFTGLAGPALFLLRLYEATGEEHLLDQAQAVLEKALTHCVWTEDDTLQADEGWRILPYLATGTAGLGVVLSEFLRHRAVPEFVRADLGIRHAAEPEFIVQAGLFNGRAGLISYLLHRQADPDLTRRLVEAHSRHLGWHAVPYRGRIAFVGDQLMRLSMDLATGTASVLAVLRPALTGGPLTLPFLFPGGEALDLHDREEVIDHGQHP